MWLHYTSVTDPVMFVDNCTETVTEDGKLILHLTYCAFTRKVREDKSVMFLQEKNKKI
jgi:hypothetical protein